MSEHAGGPIGPPPQLPVVVLDRHCAAGCAPPPLPLRTQLSSASRRAWRRRMR